MSFFNSIITIAIASCLNINSLALNNTHTLNLYINGQKPTCDIIPIIKNDKTLVPVKGIFENLGFDIKLDDSLKTVQLSNTKKHLQLQVNNSTAIYNQENITLDTPPTIFNNQTYIPLRFACEILGFEVTWIDKTNTINIIDKTHSQQIHESQLPTSTHAEQSNETTQTKVNVEQPSGAKPSNSIILENCTTDILAPASATVEQAMAWAKNKGATETFINLAPIYWELCPLAGIDPAIAYAQSAKETGYGNFTGIVDEDFHNPCGLKTSNGGSDKNKNAHMRFEDWRTGVMAHIDHLALYAGAKGYPKEASPDPRHFPYLFGKAARVEELGAKWAPSADYGKNLLNCFLSPLRNTKVN